MKREDKERIVDIDEFKEGYEFEEKRRVRLTLSYVNEDGSLDEIESVDCDGAFAFAFNDWDKETGAHNGCRKTAVKVSELDMAGSLLSDEELQGVCGMIAVARAEEAVNRLIGGFINGAAKEDE